ncbi:MAG: disulfide bond formation protein B [Caldilineaceae bacterium]|nr:disulfide bond formation protein B [Caldilineaceae bacterium]
MERLLERYGLYGALSTASTAMFGSLYFSEVAGYVPCVYCWYQRILMYPLVAILTVGLLRRDKGLAAYVLPFSLLGIGVSTYHYLLQKTQLFDSSAVCQVGVPCTSIWINWFGFVTIPFLALTAFLIITGLTLIALQAGEPDSSEPVPGGRVWLPVVAAILLGLVIVGVYGLLNRPTATVQTFSELSVVETAAQHATSANLPANLDGAALYQSACAVCHGQEMEGVAGLGSALQRNETISRQSDDELLTFIRQGLAANHPTNASGVSMPPSAGQPNLTDAEILAVVQHLRTNQAIN